MKPVFDFVLNVPKLYFILDLLSLFNKFVNVLILTDVATFEWYS